MGAVKFQKVTLGQNDSMNVNFNVPLASVPNPMLTRHVLLIGFGSFFPQDHPDTGRSIDGPNFVPKWGRWIQKDERRRG